MSEPWGDSRALGTIVPPFAIFPLPGVAERARPKSVKRVAPSAGDVIETAVLGSYSMTETVFDGTGGEDKPELATYAIFVILLTPRPRGLIPTPIVATTVFIEPSITDIVFPEPDAKLGTYTLFVLAFTPAPRGSLPTDTVATTILVEPSITDTVLEPELATYAMFVTSFTPT